MEEDMDKQLKLKFLMFENETNICWLDASIALIAHNRSLKKIVESSPDSQINKIISTYNEAIATFNSSVCEQTLKSPEMLKEIQANTLKYLKQSLKFKPGEPDSAFCALLNLIYQDKSDVKECLNVSWIWRKQCPSCGTNSKSAICKPIITLSKVNAFHPECPSSIYTCTCKSEQEMKLIYKELPPCLIFHFEKGVGTGTNFTLTFYIKGREYHLTSIVILEKSSTDLNLNHFVTWIRDPLSNMWLECNDLNPGFASFSPIKPEFYLKDVYIAVYEAFDDLGRINNEIATDQEQDVENDNVELIDLSDEENDTVNTGSCCNTSASQSSKSIKNDEISNFSKNSFSEVDAFKKEMFTDDKKDIDLQNLKMCNDGKSKESEKPCNIRNQKGSLCKEFLPIKISHDKHTIEVKSKTFDYQDKSVEDFIEAKESRNEATDNTEHKVSESSIASKKEVHSCPSVNNETSTIENLEMCDKEKPKESEEDCNISYQKMSVSNFNLPNKLSPSKQKTEVKSNKAVEKSLEARKFKPKATDNPKHSPANKFCTSTIQNVEMSSNENIKKSKKTYNITRQNISANARRFSSESSNKHEVEAKSKNSNDQNKPVKEFIAEATKYPEPKVTDTSIERKKEKKLNSFDPDTIVENIITDETTHEEPPLTKCRYVEDTSGVRKNEVNKHDEKKSQIEMNQIPFKKSVISNNNENKRERAGDNYATSSKRRRERSNDKCVSPNKEKSVVIINDQTASTTSQADGECAKNTLARSKRSGKSDSSSGRKKTKLSNGDNTDEKPNSKSSDNTDEKPNSKSSDNTDEKPNSESSDNTDEKPNSNSSPNKISKETIRDVIDTAVTKTFAAFFERIIQIHNSQQ